MNWIAKIYNAKETLRVAKLVWILELWVYHKGSIHPSCTSSYLPWIIFLTICLTGIIFLTICLTGIIFLTIRLTGIIFLTICLTGIIFLTIYLTGIIFLTICLTGIILLYALRLYTVSSVSVHPLRRSYAYKILLTDGRIHVQAVFEDLISGVLIADVYQTKAVKRMYELYHTP